MPSKQALALGLAAMAAVVLASPPAFADAIDGHWCREGAHFTIRGPAITTPAGRIARGTYDRHAFLYVDEDGGFAEGAEIHMRLLNQETLRLFVGRPQGDGEIWQRCDFVS